MATFIGFIIFVVAWVVVDFLLNAAKVKSTQAYMASGAILGVMLSSYLQYFGG